MKIKKISGKWVPKEDRLHLFISADDKSEYRFWLMRSGAKKIIEFRESVVKPLLIIKLNKNLLSNKSISHKKLTSDDDLLYPLGKEPILIHNIELRLVGGLIDIVFYLTGKKTFKLTVMPHLINTLTDLVDNLQKKASWKLDLDYGFLENVVIDSTIH
jgi:hypothetical protein